MLRIEVKDLKVQVLDPRIRVGASQDLGSRSFIRVVKSQTTSK